MYEVQGGAYKQITLVNNVVGSDYIFYQIKQLWEAQKFGKQAIGKKVQYLGVITKDRNLSI